MKAAIYTRFSTDKQDSNSTTAQIRNCKRLIEGEGWKLGSIFSDEGITGSDNERPEYLRLLAESEAGDFDVIVVDETSRFTRAEGELQRQLAWLKFRGQFLVDCRGFDSRNSGSELIAAVSGFMDAQELEKIRHRTHRGQRETVLLDFSPGGRAYGYSSEPVQTDRKRRWRIVVVADQANIVREVFERYADGEGLKAIAELLNRRGVPSPGSTWNRKQRRCRGWVHSAVRGILKNERYTGQIIWNRSKWVNVPFSSKRKRIERPRDEWLTRELPDLEIVPPALWKRVEARFAAPSRRAQARAQKKTRGRPSKYLLSGIMVCGVCGSNMVIESRGRYACSSKTNGGSILCDNNLRVESNVADEALLAGIRDQLLSDEMVAYMKRRALERTHKFKRRVRCPSVDQLQAELQTVEGKLERIADAVEKTGVTDTLTKRLCSLEEKKVALEKQIADSSRQSAADQLPEIIPKLVGRYRELVAEVGQLGWSPQTTSSDVQKARSVLVSLFGQIKVYPRDGVLVATPKINAAGLVRDSAAINRSFLVAGVRSQRYQALFTALDILARGPHLKTVKAPPPLP